MSILDRLLANITPEDMAQTDRRMGIPLLIDQVMKSKGISHREFAKKIGKKTADIPLLLSGHHNFTVEELTKIEFVLETKLFFSKELDWTPHVVEKIKYDDTPITLLAAAEP
jgi:ribosome-binding protein aMBF1 (putative translation factor)